MEAAGWLHWLGYAESGLPWAALLGRLAVAGLLGAVVGFEREFHDKPLGLRTHILVALGACGFSLLALGIVFVATVVFAPQGLLGNVLRLPSPRRFATSKKLEDKSRSVGQVEPDAK